MLTARKEVEMTDQGSTGGSADDGATQRRSDWANETEKALEGVGIALREAWEASRDARVSALESAKKAALQLGEAIDKGVVAARQKWEDQDEGTPAQDVHAVPPVAPKMGPDDGLLEEE
jgi:hypothetical protein